MIDIGFIGNATKDAELRVTQGGTNVCSFTVAVNDRYKKDAPPTFFRVTAWRKLAETCGQYVKKGMKIYVHCDKIEAQPFESNGETKVNLAVQATDVEFLSKVGESEGGSYERAPKQEAQPQFTDVTGDMYGEELPF